jgi:hypothetical protein
LSLKAGLFAQLIILLNIYLHFAASAFSAITVFSAIAAVVFSAIAVFSIILAA